MNPSVWQTVFRAALGCFIDEMRKVEGSLKKLLEICEPKTSPRKLGLRKLSMGITASSAAKAHPAYPRINKLIGKLEAIRPIRNQLVHNDSVHLTIYNLLYMASDLSVIEGELNFIIKNFADDDAWRDMAAGCLEEGCWDGVPGGND